MTPTAEEGGFNNPATNSTVEGVSRSTDSSINTGLTAVTTGGDGGTDFFPG